MDTTELKVAAALLSSFDAAGRVLKTSYRPLLETISQNVSAMIANRSKAQVTNDKPITRERMADKLMHSDRRMATRSMADHAGMIKAQPARGSGSHKEATSDLWYCDQQSRRDNLQPEMGNSMLSHGAVQDN